MIDHWLIESANQNQKVIQPKLKVIGSLTKTKRDWYIQQDVYQLYTKLLPFLNNSVN
jgi:hypothetical protein